MDDNPKHILYAQIEDDVTSFLSSLDAEESSGVPPPPKVEFEEVSLNPAEFDLLPFGTQGAGTKPAPPTTPPEPTIAACCKPDNTCEDLTSEDCATAGGVFRPGKFCSDPDPCPCPTNETIFATFSGYEACECIEVTGPNLFAVFDVSVDGTYELTKTIDTPDVTQWEGFGGSVHFQQWSDDGCVGTLEEECDSIGYIVVQCGRRLDGSFYHTITYGIAFFDVCITGWGSAEAQIFRRNNVDGIIPFGGSEDTQIGCGETGTGIGLAQVTDPVFSVSLST